MVVMISVVSNPYENAQNGTPTNAIIPVTTKTSTLVMIKRGLFIDFYLSLQLYANLALKEVFRKRNTVKISLKNKP